MPLDPAGPEIEVRVNRRAKRILLRADAARAVVVLVLPSPRHRSAGLGFAARRADWIHARLAEMAARIPFEDGMTLPLLGRPHRVRHRPGGAPGVSVADGEIRIGGPAARLPRLLAAWLRMEASRILAERSRALAAGLGAQVSRVTVRDTRSRWGSCSPSGALSYSWRLVLAPETVLDYVVAHEVAHLRVPNHGPRFWATVGALCPDHMHARRWLKANGAALHRYG